MIPSLSLLVVLATYWLVCRIYGWRATLSPSTFLMFFTFGCVGSMLVALYLEAIPMPFPLEQGTMYTSVAPATWLTGPAIEEIAKIIPLLLIVGLVPAVRRLGIADFTLIGFSTGLGFGFVEANLSRVLSSDLFGWGTVWLFGSGGGTRQGSCLMYDAPHWAAAALVGLGLGIGVRLWPNRLTKWLPGAVMLLLVTFGHSMWNFKQQHQWPNSCDLAAPLIERLYALTLHGYLAIVALPALLILATIAEGWWSWRAVDRRGDLLLAGEADHVASEPIFLFQHRLMGFAPLARILRYFRSRRGVALAFADARRAPHDKDAARFVESASAALLAERAEIAALAPQGWLPQRREIGAAIVGVIKRHWIGLLVSVAVLLIFAVAPRQVPWVHHGVFRWFVVVAALALAARGLIRFRREGSPDPTRSDGEALARHSASAMLLGSSAFATAIPLAALVFNPRWLIPGAVAYISSWMSNWIQSGGSPGTLIAGGGAGGGAVAGGGHKTPAPSKHTVDRPLSGSSPETLPDKPRPLAQEKPADGPCTADQIAAENARLDGEVAEYQRQLSAIQASVSPEQKAMKASLEQMEKELIPLISTYNTKLAAYEKALSERRERQTQETRPDSAGLRAIAGLKLSERDLQIVLQSWYNDLTMEMFPPIDKKITEYGAAERSVSASFKPQRDKMAELGRWCEDKITLKYKCISPSKLWQKPDPDETFFTNFLPHLVKPSDYMPIPPPRWDDYKDPWETDKDRSRRLEKQFPPLHYETDEERKRRLEERRKAGETVDEMIATVVDPLGTILVGIAKKFDKNYDKDGNFIAGPKTDAPAPKKNDENKK